VLLRSATSRSFPLLSSVARATRKSRTREKEEEKEEKGAQEKKKRKDKNNVTGRIWKI